MAKNYFGVVLTTKEHDKYRLVVYRYKDPGILNTCPMCQLLRAIHKFQQEYTEMERERFSTFEGAERAIWKKVGADVSDENSATETRLDAIRKLDKFHLAVFLNDVHSGAKDFPSNNMSWCDWLNKPDDGHLLDVKTAR